MNATRPSELSSETYRDLLWRLSGGCPVSLACRFTGIDHSSFTEWRKRGSHSEHSTADYRRFYLDTEQAIAKGSKRKGSGDQ